MSLVNPLVERLREAVRSEPRGRMERMRQIAEGSGVTLKTVSNLYYGATSDMRHSNALKIERYLNEHFGRRESDRQLAAWREPKAQLR